MSCTWLRNTNGRCTHSARQQSLPAFDILVRNTSGRIHRRLLTYRCIDDHVYQVFPSADFSRKIRGIVQSTRDLSVSGACDRDCRAWERTCICVEKKERKKSFVSKSLSISIVWSLLPVLLLMILRSPVNRVCFSDVVRVLRNVLVSPVASRDLILVVASQTIANLNSRRTVETIFEWVTNDSEVWQTHPTCFDWTRSRHSVTFALFAHLLLNVL